jgi:hypothetical protein
VTVLAQPGERTLRQAEQAAIRRQFAPLFQHRRAVAHLSHIAQQHGTRELVAAAQRGREGDPGHGFAPAFRDLVPQPYNADGFPIPPFGLGLTVRSETFDLFAHDEPVARPQEPGMGFRATFGVTRRGQEIQRILPRLGNPKIRRWRRRGRSAQSAIELAQGATAPQPYDLIPRLLDESVDQGVEEMGHVVEPFGPVGIGLAVLLRQGLLHGLDRVRPPV